jgi:2-phospho-L-lactate/phosphoenolpyruvate guanylyltransferase
MTPPVRRPAPGHTVAILPVKRFGAAKQRLDNDLSEGTRRALAEAMVTDVLIALRRAKSIDEVLVVSGETMAVALAAGYDAAAVVDDPEDAGHSAAALRGIAAAIERGATRVLLVPGDCPALDPAELDDLLADADAEAAGDPAVVVVPDRHGDGTNALLLTPPSGPRSAPARGSAMSAWPPRRARRARSPQ